MSGQNFWRGVIFFALGGTLLFFGVYYFIENANKPWIDKTMFTWFFAFPVCSVAFFAVGLGLALIIKSSPKKEHAP